MTNDKRPREWKLDQMGSNDSSDQIDGPLIIDGPVHVIEHSAFAALKADAEKLAAALEDAKAHYEQGKQNGGHMYIVIFEALAEWRAKYP